jgi:hypothetical protein
MSERKVRRYRGVMPFRSIVTGDVVFDRGNENDNVFFTPNEAVSDVRGRIERHLEEGTEVVGGFVEEVNPDGGAVSAVTKKVDR